MKRLLIIILLLISTSALAQEQLARMNVGIVAGGAGVSTRACPDVTYADILCEDLQKTGGDCGDASHTNCELSWTVTGSGTVDFNQTISGTITGKVSGVALEVNDTDASGYTTVETNTSDIDEVYHQFYFNLINTLGANDRIHIVLAGCSTDDCSAGVYPWNIVLTRVDATNYKFGLRYHTSGGSASTVASSSATNYQLNTWYGIRVHWKKNAASTDIGWGIQNDVGVDSWTVEAVTAGDTHATVQQKGIISGGGYATGDTPKWQLINIKSDASVYPAATSP